MNSIGLRSSITSLEGVGLMAPLVMVLPLAMAVPSAMARALKGTIPIQFQAQWSPENRHLKETFDSKVATIAYNVFSVVIPIIALYRLGVWVLKKICRFAILPSSISFLQNTDEQRKRFLKYKPFQSYFDRKYIELSTPDGVKLSAVLFEYKRSIVDMVLNKIFQGNTPTIIACLPNAATLYELPCRDLMLQLQRERRSCDVLVFDYRGCGDSKGEATSSNQLILDGETAYQFIRDKQQIKESNIHFYGHSLGGGIAAEVKALHPKSGKYVSNRSFRSMASEIRALTIAPLAWLARLAHWTSFDAEAAFKKMDTSSSKMILYHEKDAVIPTRAQLRQALKPTDSIMIKKLYFPELESNGKEIKGSDAHCEDLSEAKIVGERISASQKVTRFFLGKQSILSKLYSLHPFFLLEYYSIKKVLKQN